MHQVALYLTLSASSSTVPYSQCIKQYCTLITVSVNISLPQVWNMLLLSDYHRPPLQSARKVQPTIEKTGNGLDEHLHVVYWVLLSSFTAVILTLILSSD